MVQMTIGSGEGVEDWDLTSSEGEDPEGGPTPKLAAGDIRFGMEMPKHPSQARLSFSELEAAADRLLSRQGLLLDGTRVFTEQRLLRKIRRELERLSEPPTEGLPQIVCGYLLDRYVVSVCEHVGLTGMRRAIYSLYLRGYSRADIASKLRISSQLVIRSIKRVRKIIHETPPDKYAGLYEVYWREVHRYVYRKPQRVW